MRAEKIVRNQQMWAGEFEQDSRRAAKFAQKPSCMMNHYRIRWFKITGGADEDRDL
jgi:hypothetical protein